MRVRTLTGWALAGWVVAGLVPLGVVSSCGRAPAPPPPPAPSHVQVVAHPDDDILFMNPDLSGGIRRHEATTSIYLTGGESSLPDPQRYVTQRQDGTRAAFARMAAAPDDWQRTTVPAAGNRPVEVDQLRGRPEVRLVFLNLPEDADPAAAGGEHSLTRLHDDRSGRAEVRTLVPDAGVVRQPQTYRREDVVANLAALYQRFAPTTIGLQDSQPDPRYRNEWGRFHNHPDHVVGSDLAREAADRYQARSRRHPHVINYRDYNVSESPVNLPRAERAAKHDEFGIYTRHDAEADTGGAYADWISHSRYRWPEGSQWAGRDGRGVVHAFAVRGNEIGHWQRTRQGWQPVRWSPAPAPLRPALRVVDQGGRLALVAQSLDGHHVLLNRQAPDGTWPQQWQDLGAPAGQSGAPIAVADSRARLVVLARNEAGGVSASREQPSGRFAGWRDLGGRDVQGSATAVLGPDDRLNVFAATNDNVLRWREPAPGRPLPAAPEPFLGVAPASAPVAARGPDRSVRLLLEPAGAETVDAYALAPGSDQWSGPHQLPNPGGMGGPALAAGTALVRDSSGTVHAARPGGGWVDLGGPVSTTPAAVSGPGGRTTLLATGPDGQLLCDEQLPGPDLRFAGWRPVGPGHRPAEAARPR